MNTVVATSLSNVPSTIVALCVFVNAQSAYPSKLPSNTVTSPFAPFSIATFPPSNVGSVSSDPTVISPWFTTILLSASAINFPLSIISVPLFSLTTAFVATAVNVPVSSAIIFNSPLFTIDSLSSNV